MKVSHFIPHASPPPSTHKLPHPAFFFFKGICNSEGKGSTRREADIPNARAEWGAGAPNCQCENAGQLKTRFSIEIVPMCTSSTCLLYLVKYLVNLVNFDWQMDTPAHRNYQDQKALTTERPRKTLLVTIWKGKPVPICCGGIVKTTNSLVK